MYVHLYSILLRLIIFAWLQVLGKCSEERMVPADLATDCSAPLKNYLRLGGCEPEGCVRLTGAGSDATDKLYLQQSKIRLHSYQDHLD